MKPKEEKKLFKKLGGKAPKKKGFREKLTEKFKSKGQKIGDPFDARCKAGISVIISRKICRNNCKEWDRFNRKCRLGY